MRYLSQTRRPGYALATIIILMGVVLFASGAMVSISVLESKISRSQEEGTKAYYVAEAGVEDALWRIKNISSYDNALQNNTLNITYTATNVPVSGSSFTVTLKNGTSGAGYGVIDVVSQVTNSLFTASRHITTNIFQGPSTNSVGTNAVMAGQNLNINNGNAQVNITSGDLYGGTIGVTNGSVSVAGNILSPGDYSVNNATVTDQSIQANNYPPSSPTMPVPGFDFSPYTQSGSCTTYYTTASFKAYISGLPTGPVNLSGPVTCVDGGISFGTWVNDYTLNITGMLVVTNGSITATGNISDFTVNVADPGNGKSGVFVQGQIHNIKGTWNVDGTVYASGDISLNNSPNITINGALISGTNITINTGSAVNLSFVASRVTAVGFTTGTPSVVNIQHWEDQY